MSATKEISMILNNNRTELSAELYKGKISIEIDSDITDMYERASFAEYERASFAELDIDQAIKFRDYISDMILIMLKEKGE